MLDLSPASVLLLNLLTFMLGMFSAHVSIGRQVNRMEIRLAVIENSLGVPPGGANGRG